MPNPKVRTLTIGGVTYDLQDNISGYITGITSSDVTTALGFTPYNATNPNGYTSNTGTITSVKTTAGAHTTINVSSGAVNFNVPTKTSDLTNDSGFITSAPVTSVNGQTGAVTISVPTATSDLTNDSNFLTSGDFDTQFDDRIAIPTFYACDSTSQAVMAQLRGGTPQIKAPSDFTSLFYLMFIGLEPRIWFCWMNGTEMEFARMSVSVNTGTSTITLYLRGRTSIATGIMGVDNSWTVTDILPIYNGGVS